MANLVLSEAQLEDAVARGLITADQMKSMREIGAAPMPGMDEDMLSPDRDDERFRFLNGFNDIFLSIGIVLITVAVFSLGPAAAVSPIVAAIVLGLSELLVRRRRTVLPGIVLATIFAIAFARLGAAALEWLGFSWAYYDNSTSYYLLAAGSLAAAAIGGVAYYSRYRLPFALFTIGSCTALALVYGAIWLHAPPVGKPLEYFTETAVVVPAFIAGLVLFAAAMRFDISDPQRNTRRADCAFWLHMAAAPLLVHPVIAPLISGIKAGAGAGVTGNAILVLALVSVMGVVALGIDRRAMLVASLSYLITALAYLVNTGGNIGRGPITASLLFVGILVLVLGMNWHGLRRSLLGLIPDGPLKRMLPPPPQSA